MQSRQRGKYNLERLRTYAGCHGYCRRPGNVIHDGNSICILHSFVIVLVLYFCILAPRDCVISPDNFCFICGEYTVKSQQGNISDFMKKVYFACFKLKLGDQDKHGFLTRTLGAFGENYNDLSKILDTINHQEHRWIFCGDFKILIMLLGQQAGYTIIPSPYGCRTVELETSIGPNRTGHFEVP
ncbi:hypothetical protein AVEN_142272-1 [Araneus ventricosus]|uniref:Uncharacterized protein n=1 Tax=Araneus ventricosus TaxID=182803 RepID=A0A4Y2GK55_ARAVE|nr:hypothetical protein AVEN_142272-1 [Araneus ventricosus]